MKKRLMAITLSTAIFCGIAGCTGTTVNSGSSAPDFDNSKFETTQKFITIADLPPDPNGSLADYKGLGFSGFILTEDFVSLTSGGKMTDGYKKAIKALNDSGLDVYIRNQYNDPYYFDTTADGSSEYERKYSLDNRRLTNEFKENGGVKGFYMADEPDYDKLSSFAPLINWYNANYSDTYFHMNLFPSYAGQTVLKGHTYGEYVQEYIDKIIKNVNGKKSVCLDNYPFSKKGVIRPSFLSDLLIAALKTAEYNKSVSEKDKAYMGICVQTFYDSGLVDIQCSQDVSFQLLTGMAVGANLFEYFCYRSYVDGAVRLNGIMDTNMQKRVYDYVRQANEKYLDFSKVICAFDWYGVNTVYASDKKRIENEDAFSSVQDMTLENTGSLDLSKSKSKLDTLIGSFKKGENDGYLAVNYTLPSGGKSNVVELCFKNSEYVAIYRTGESGLTCSTVKLTDGVVRIALDAGDGAFIIPLHKS